MYYTNNQIEHIINLIKNKGTDNVSVSRLDIIDEYHVGIISTNADENIDAKDFSSYFIGLNFKEDIYTLRHYKIPKEALLQLQKEDSHGLSIKALASTEAICFTRGFLTWQEGKTSFVDFINGSKYFHAAKDLSSYVESIEQCNHDIIKEFVYNINDSSILMIKTNFDIEELFEPDMQSWCIDIITADTKLVLAQLVRTSTCYKLLLDFDDDLNPNIKCPITSKSNLISALAYISEILTFPQYKKYVDELANMVR